MMKCVCGRSVYVRVKGKNEKLYKLAKITSNTAYRNQVLGPSISRSILKFGKIDKYESRRDSKTLHE